MEEDIQNYSPLVMFRGTPCMKIFVWFSTSLDLFNKIQIGTKFLISQVINNTKKGRLHFRNARTRKSLCLLFQKES